MGALAAAVVIAVVFALVTTRSNQRYSAGITPLLRWALPAGALALFGVSLAMLGRYLGYRSPVFAVIAAADILGFVALTRPAFSWRLPARAARLAAWEREGTWYRRIGVPLFGAAIRRSPLRYLNRTVYLAGQGARLAEVHASLLAAEGAHFWAVVPTVPLLAYAMLLGWWDSVLWVCVFHGVLNAYPTLHLRSVRARIERARVRPGYLATQGPV
jgi:Glycosyl-4,4'-diaponeurosporenoate acyltransferase